MAHGEEIRASRVQQGLCSQCGKEPLVSKLLGEACLQRKKGYDQKRTDRYGTGYNRLHAAPVKRCPHCGLGEPHVCVRGDASKGLGGWTW